MELTKRRVLMIGVAVVGTIPLLGASCAVTQPFADSGAPKIQFEGDSITVMSASDIDAHYGSVYDVAVDAHTGTTTYEQQGTIASDAANHPQVVVVDLGTNDAGVVITGRSVTLNGATTSLDPVEPITDVEDRLDQIAAEFAPACEVFVTINTQDPAFYGADASEAIANAQAINDHIRSMPGIQVADWDAVLQPSDFDVTNGVSSAPHPNEVGIQAMLSIEDQAISRCPPPATTTTDTTSTTVAGGS